MADTSNILLYICTYDLMINDQNVLQNVKMLQHHLIIFILLNCPATTVFISVFHDEAEPLSTVVIPVSWSRRSQWSYCLDQTHCGTYGGGNKLIFGEGTKVTAESSEYQLLKINQNVGQDTI